MIIFFLVISLTIIVILFIFDFYALNIVKFSIKTAKKTSTLNSNF